MSDQLSQNDSFPESVVRNPQFQRVWAVGAMTAMVRWLDWLVLGVFTFELTDSASKVAIVFLIRMLPRLLFGIFIGTLVDRLNRKWVWVLSLVLLSVISAVLGILIANDDIKFWHIIIAVFGMGLIWSIEFPTRRSIIGDVVGRKQVGRAVGLDWSTDSFSKMIGPALGGALIVTVGTSGAYILACTVCALAAVVASTLTYQKLSHGPTGNGLLQGVLDGLRYVRKRNLLLGALCVTVVFNIVFPAYNSLLPVIGKDILGASPLYVGILGSLEGFGSLLGSLWIATWASSRQYVRIYYFGTALFLGCCLAFSQSEFYILSAAITFILGFGFAAFATMQTTILVTTTDVEMRGRVLGILSLCIGAGPIGVLQIGPLVAAVGEQTGLAIVVAEGVILLIAAAVVWPVLLKKRLQ